MNRVGRLEGWRLEGWKAVPLDRAIAESLRLKMKEMTAGRLEGWRVGRLFETMSNYYILNTTY